jgi:hypothetical protein
MMSLKQAALAAGALFALSAAPASAQSTTDVFNGATVTNTSPLLECCGGSASGNLFGGTGGVEAPNLLFADQSGTSQGFIQFVEFTIPALPADTGVAAATLYAQSDEGTENGNRNTSGFRLLADADANGTFETVLVPLIDPLDNTGATPTNTYAFAPTAATAYRAEFTKGGGSGSRLVELDAITGPIPEPGTVSLLALGGLGLLARRRRRA